MKFRSSHGGSFHHFLAPIPSHMRTNSEHKVLAAWLNGLAKSGDSSCASPLAGLDLLNDMADMLNLDGVENVSVTDMLSTPLTTEIEDVDSPTEICSKCNYNNIPSSGSADTSEMTDAISQSLCLSCSLGVTQTEKSVIEDLDTVGSSCLGKGSSGHHNCKTSRDSEKDDRFIDVSLCASSNELVSDTVKVPNPMQFLPHFLFSGDNVETGSNDTLSFKSPLRSLKANSTEDNVEVVIPKTSLPQNPLQLLPHMVKQSDNLSAKQLSSSSVVEPVKDDKINLHCKEKRMETGVLRNCAGRNSIDTQLQPVMKPASSKRHMPKHHLKTEVRDSLKQPLGCEKLEETVNPVHRNLCNQQSGCDRWSLQGVSSRLKASLWHDDCRKFIDRMCHKYYILLHFNELEFTVGRRFDLFSFPMKSLEKDVIYSTTADVVAFGKKSKRPIVPSETEVIAEKSGSTVHERRPKNLDLRKKSDCILASIGNKLHKADIQMSRWWDVLSMNFEEAEYVMLLERIAQSMPNWSNTQRVPAAEVIDAAEMSKLSMCSARRRSGGNIVLSARQSLLVSSERKANPIWSKMSCNFRWKSCNRRNGRM